MPGDLAQDFLFQRIREMLPRHQSLVDVVSEILHISSDSAYRRIRGETPLVLEEARQLCLHYQLSLDQLLQIRSEATLFHASRIPAGSKGLDNYLRDLLEQLRTLSQFGRREILLLTKDIHLFANLISLPFFAFRYYFWNKSVLQDPAYATKGFSPDCLGPDMQALRLEMLQLFQAIPSVEIWNTESVNSLLFQVEYYREAGYFSSAADIRLVYESVEEMLRHLQAEVEYGTKFLPGENPELKRPNLRFFHNRIALGDNAVLVQADATRTVYLNYDVLNYLVTRDEKFCNDTYLAMQNLLRRSTQISETSEKQRNIFFNILVAKVRERIRNL
ncbi:MAG TPA: hypothetical protein VG870_08390 [Chitinophagaceae bacterium]|nr:hypothetical protein [Chitinophagaceae bacterium]